MKRKSCWWVPGCVLGGMLSAGLMGFGQPPDKEAAAGGYALTPLSGADGKFETVKVDGRDVHRGLRDDKGDYAPYLYFRVPDEARKARDPVYVEVTYQDVGAGRLSLQYNARDPQDNYRRAEAGYDTLLTNRGGLRTAVFKLANPDFRGAQNLRADLRLVNPDKKNPLQVVRAVLSLEPTPLFGKHDAKPWLEPYRGPTRSDVDAKTLRRKVLCGYQGWFRCPGDGTERGWVHWSRESARLAPDTLTFEMWPDLGEFTEEEKYPAPGFTHPDGSQAHLFSSANPRTIDRHFEWMRQHGLDGVLVQRFVVGLDDPAEAARVLGYARHAANRTGRVFAVEYDMTGMPPEKLYDRLVSDWKWLVDVMKITSDPRYLHHDGRPVLGVWGFFRDRFDAALAHKILDFFQKDQKYRACVVGGCQWHWRTEKDPGWAKVFRRFDVISPWNVGHTMREKGQTYAATGYWAQDLAEARKAGRLYLPVLYPGFSWDNLKQKPPGSTLIPRRGGDFFWQQFHAAANLGLDMAKVAMFDEVDEGTAVFKVANAPPKQAHFVAYDGRPADWYLRLTGEGTRLLRRERPNTKAIPIKP